MTILVFAVIVFLVGVLLGLWFKVYVLCPAMAVSLTTIVGVGFIYENSIGFVLFLIFLGITALQLGYFSGAVIAAYGADAHQQKRRQGIIEAAQRLFRESQT